MNFFFWLSLLLIKRFLTIRSGQLPFPGLWRALAKNGLLLLLAALALVLQRSNNHPPQQQQQPDTQSATTAKPGHEQVGVASWYGPSFQGKETASGQSFSQDKLTAAHPSLPLGTKAEVTDVKTGKKVEVTINDRGPYSKHRSIDLSKAAANKIGIKKKGTAVVKIRVENKPKHKKRHRLRK